MDFPIYQAQARVNTLKLVLLGLFGLAAIIAATSALLMLLLYTVDSEWLPLTALVLGGPLTAITVAAIAAGKSYLIRDGGGRYVARALGGREVDFSTREPSDRRLVNVIEEIAIASGTPAPAVFVLDAEPAINAFAAGWNIDNAAIGVTRGALQHLSRNELQGVLAHEFAHIINGDTRAKTRIIGWVFGITGLYSIGWLMFNRAADRHHPNHPVIIVVMLGVGMGLCAIGFVGSIFGELIQAAVSRQREYLADASAVEFTRYPDGIGEALKKTGGIAEHGRLVAAVGRETNHLFFAAAFGRLFDTHPSLTKRIGRILPSWDGKYTIPEALRPEVKNAPFSSGGWADILPVPEGFPGVLGPAVLAEASPVPGGRLGTETFQAPTFEGPTAEHLEYARALIARIPDDTQAFLHTQGGAVGALVGLLVSPDGPSRFSELSQAAALTGMDAGYIEQAAAAVSTLDRPLHLPAIDMALHTIRQAPDDFHDDFARVIRTIDTARPTKDLYRWTLRRVLLRHLDDQYDDGAVVHRLRFDRLHVEASVAFAVIAWFNSSGVGAAQESFDSAHTAAKMPLVPIPRIDDLAVGRVDNALDSLAQLDPIGRKRFVIGATAAVLHDEKTTAEEAELIRVIADAVRMPMPPLLPC